MIWIAALDVGAGLAHLGAMNIAGRLRGARLVAIVALSVGLMSARGGSVSKPGGGVSARMAKLPRVTVWAWERREDLRGVDPRTTAVAFLARTIEVDDSGVQVVPRRQPMLLPADGGLVRIAAVRIEVANGTTLDENSALEVAAAIAGAVGASSVQPLRDETAQGWDTRAAVDQPAALQVDFDSRVSQREWYAAVLGGVRARMPKEMPLSMTALASWCSYDNGWMRGLPVDEAVPMLFRMEPDRRRTSVTGWGTGDFTLREPMCAGVVGISTREAWPAELRGRRVYVFADRGWSRDGLEETVRSLE